MSPDDDDQVGKTKTDRPLTAIHTDTIRDLKLKLISTGGKRKDAPK